MCVSAVVSSPGTGPAGACHCHLKFNSNGHSAAVAGCDNTRTHITALVVALCRFFIVSTAWHTNFPGSGSYRFNSRELQVRHSTNVLNIWMYGLLPELRLLCAKNPRTSCLHVLAIISLSGTFLFTMENKQVWHRLLTLEKKNLSWCLMQFQIWRLTMKRSRDTPPDLLPSVYRSSEELLFGCVFGLLVWPSRSSVWSVLSAKSCWMYRLEHLKTKLLEGL